MVDPAKWSGEITGEALAFGENRDVLYTGDLGPQPTAHTVLLAVEKTSSDGPGTFQALPTYYAECTMKAGQYSARFLCDWRGQFAAVFQSLQVRALSYESLILASDLYSQPQGTFRHTVLVGYGGWNATRPLTYTMRQQEFDSGGAESGSLVIQVPRFGRRFFPRLMHFNGDWDVPGAVPSVPLNPARLSGISVKIDAGYQGVLTEQQMMEGIDVHGASLIQLLARNDLAATHLVTPVFELAL